MDSLEELFDKINIEETQNEIQVYNSETKVLIQNFETLKWLKVCIKEHKNVSIDLLSSFLIGLKYKFSIYVTKNFDETTEVIKDFMLIYNKHIEAVLDNKGSPYLSLDFMIEIAFQIHKILLSTLKL